MSRIDYRFLPTALAAFAASVLLSAAAPSAAPPVKVVSHGPALQMGAEQFVLHSRSVGRDFLIEVTAPGAPLSAGQKLPAIFALDGGYGVAGPIGRMLGETQAMAPAFIVAVGYLPSGYKYRDNDLTHRKLIDGKVVDGGGAAFEAFLLDELRPFIEARYPVDPNAEILFGHSLGGIFAANVLAEHPDAFHAYLIASPSVWADPAVIGRVAAAVARGGGRRVFVSVGGAEDKKMLDGFGQLTSTLGQPGSALIVKSHVFAGGNHLSYYTAMIPEAFDWLNPPPEQHAPLN